MSLPNILSHSTKGSAGFGRVFVKFLNSSAQIGNNRDQNNYLLKTCYTASCEVAGTQIEIAE